MEVISKKKKKGGMCVKYGYCRISTTYQNEDRQIIALTEAGVPQRNIITDQKSGKDFDQLPKLLSAKFPNAFRCWQAGKSPAWLKQTNAEWP